MQVKTICRFMAFSAVVALFSPTVWAQAENGLESTIDDQQDVAVTIYNNDLALVRERRNISIPMGEQALRFMDVPEQIRPETVSLQSLSEAGSLAVLEQNYEFDLISPQKLMEKYVGKTVELRNFDTDLTIVDTVEAKLLSVNNGPVFLVDDKIFLGHPGTVVLPEMPENLIAKPTLIWLVANQLAEQQLEATYLTGGMGWKADYVLTLNTEGTQMDLLGWVTLNNQSGATYTDAKLKLVAGDINRAPEQDMRMMKTMAMESARGGFAGDMVEESFAEYHLYTLPRRTTIKQNQSKQVRLLGAEDVAVTRIYEYRGNVSYYSQQMPRLENEKVDVFVDFENEEANNLGMPLPAGVMRLYQADNDGMLQFAGEDRIGHTPKNETVKLKMGQAFDVVAERVHTDFQVLGGNSFESGFEITIRNHKESAVTVDIVEPMPLDWEILNNSHEFQKKDAHTAVFSVNVPADGEVVVKYRVRVRYR
jgi:hypothetical protein